MTTVARPAWPEQMLGRMPVAVWATDRSLRLVHGAGAAFESAGLAETLRGLADTPSDLADPDVAAHLRALRGETVHWTLRLARVLQACVAPWYDAYGRVIGVAGVAADVTDLIAEERRRRQASEDRYHAIFGRGCVAMATVDAAGRLRDANPMFGELFGYRPGDLTGLPADALVAPGPAGELPWGELVAGRSTRRRHELLLVRKDRRLFPARLTVCVVEPDRLAVCMVEPVTDPDAGGVELLPQLRLSATEVAILEKLAAGHPNTRITAELHMSRQAIDYHLVNLRAKLEAPSRSALVARAYALGLFRPGQWPPTISQPRPESIIEK